MNFGKEREREQKKEQLVAGSASKTQRDAGNSMVNTEQ